MPELECGGGAKSLRAFSPLPVRCRSNRTTTRAAVTGFLARSRPVWTGYPYGYSAPQAPYMAGTAAEEEAADDDKGGSGGNIMIIHGGLPSHGSDTPEAITNVFV